MSKHNGNVGRVSDSVTRQVQATDAPANEDVGLRFANPTYAAGSTDTPEVGKAGL
jgi:hypothetical protein